MPTSPDASVAIVGGGIIGSFIAYFLRREGHRGPVHVIERDSSYRQSSTALSAASIRTQFGCDINVRMSLFGAAMFRDLREWFGPDADIGFAERGYLIVGHEADAGPMRQAAAQQNTLGADIDVLAPADAQARHPWLNVDDVGVATFGARHEGWFDAWSLLQVVRREARVRDVDYVEAEVTGFDRSGDRVTAARLADGRTLQADWFVDAAGAQGGRVAAMLDIALPVEARKRTVFHVKAPLKDPAFPMLFDRSGAWIRPEGDGFITGIAPDADADPDAHGDFEPDHALFEDVLWPALAHRVPVLESLRLLRSWAGHYEVNTLDHNGVIGPHDVLANVVFATGFSGHGVQHAPATGRGVAEWIVHGGYRSLDLSPLGWPRIRRGEPLVESIVY